MVFIFIWLAILMPMVGADTPQADEVQANLRLSDNGDDKIGLMQTSFKPMGMELEPKIGSAFQSQSHANPRMKERGPCNCEAMNSKWSPPTRTDPKCVFIDLGAAGGNTFHSFLNGKYATAAYCADYWEWEAFLVEANPAFNNQLSQLEMQYPGKVNSLGGKAAYMCKGETTFFVDNDTRHDYWGSNMDGGARLASDWKHPNQMRNQSVANKGKHVTVPMVNVLQLIYENTIPADYVIVKMDIEGAEWDILPCLSRSQVVGSLDSLYMEVHPASWQLGNTTPAELKAAQSTLIQKGVAIPVYYSPT